METNNKDNVSLNNSGAGNTAPSYDDLDIDKTLNLPKNYLSPSAIDMYLKCPKKFEFHYVYGLTTPKTAALLKGSAIHKGIEVYYKLKLENVTDIKSQDIADYAVTKLSDLAKEDDIKLSDVDKDAYSKEVFSATKCYINNIGEVTKPVAVEGELRCVIKGVPILGYTDLIREMTDDEIKYQNKLVESGVLKEEDSNVRTVVCDNKTSNKKWYQSNLENSIQLNLYSIGTGIAQQEIHNIVLGTTNSPIYRLKAVCSNDKANHVANIIRDVAESITKGSFPRCSLGSWWCTEKFCDFYDVCRSNKI